MATVHEVTTRDEWLRLRENSQVQVVYHTAIWCGPCQALRPVLQRVMDDHADAAGVVFAKIDVDEAEQDLQRLLRVNKLPTVQIWRADDLLGEEVAPRGAQKLEDMFSECLR